MREKPYQLPCIRLIAWLLPLLLSACALPPFQAQTAANQPPAQPKPQKAPLRPDSPFTILGDANFPALLKSQSPLLDEVLDGEPQPAGDVSDNLWDRIRGGFRLPDKANPGVKADLDWYSSHSAYLERVADRARAYLYYVTENIEQRDMPTEIALLPIVESAYYPFAYSHGRASGIWQFIPGTGRRWGLKQDWWYDGRRDVYASTKAALDYLQYLHKQFHGDWLLALAAYNSGSGTVRHAIRRNKRRGRPTDFWSLDLPPETRGYVPKLLALAEIVDNPEAYGIKLDPIPDEPYFTRVDISSQIDLALAADLAGIDINELYRLNPGYNRWATAPKGPHYLLLPVDKADAFEAALDKLPPDKRVRWVRHRIARGETLGTIAHKYHTTVATLQRVNRIHGKMIRAGHHLIIPVATRSLRSYTLSAEQRRRAKQNKHRSGHKVVHIVDEGDTLWELAQRHHVSVRQLAKWNGMAPRDPLMPGQRIVIWTRHRASARHTSFIEAPPHRAVTQRVGYTVRRGDSLSRISRRFNVSVHQLRKWNRLPRGGYLHPGQSLTLYVDVTRQADNI